ncbi:MAG: response regulator [Candidatus Aminicenantes bacterium]|nr:response regulator [Candidatus Aminicenantes bacterium]
MAKILLFEDDAIQIELIKKHLEPQGHIVIVAKNGQEGIKLAREDRPDLILMDMIMPGMHGLEATIKLKEDPLTMEIPIMALTIMSSPKFVQECYRAGIVGYIKKPYNPNILLESVERIVGKPERRIARIMLVAGASRLATMIEMRLVRLGYQVNSFPGAKSAVENLAKQKPDAVFLDISLPEKHVATVFGELVRAEATKDTPVIIFSSQLSKENLESAVTRWGAHGYLTSASEINDALRSIKETTGS